VLSSPIGAHALSRASRPHVPVSLDVVDDLARDEPPTETPDH